MRGSIYRSGWLDGDYSGADDWWLIIAIFCFLLLCA